MTRKRMTPAEITDLIGRTVWGANSADVTELRRLVVRAHLGGEPIPEADTPEPGPTITFATTRQKDDKVDLDAIRSGVQIALANEMMARARGAADMGVGAAMDMVVAAARAAVEADGERNSLALSPLRQSLYLLDALAGRA